jgi:hypothetical protein
VLGVLIAGCDVNTELIEIVLSAITAMTGGWSRGDCAVRLWGETKALG